MTYIKETLSKKPLPDYLPVNIEAEISAGKFKQVKGEYWLHPKIIQKIKEVEKKMLAKSTG